MTLFQKNTTLTIIPQTPNEPKEHFIDRCNFITSQPMKTDGDYKKVVTYSYIYSNNKYLGCMYDQQTMIQLKSMTNNAYV